MTTNPEIKVTATATKWYHNGKLHRPDGPAIIRTDGTEKWYRYGKLHRVGGPAMSNLDGTEERWYYRGRLHREDGGPALISAATKEWRRHGMLHRLDGPAEIIGQEKNGYYWWVCGVPVWSLSEFQEESNCYDDDIIMLRLKYGDIIA